MTWKDSQILFLLASDVGIHEAGFQIRQNVQILDQLTSGDKTKGSSCKESSTNCEFG